GIRDFHVTGVQTCALPILDMRDGAVLWHAPLGHIDSRALVLNNVVYVPANIDEKNDKTFFHALDVTTGAVLWRVPQPGKPWGSRSEERRAGKERGCGEVAK